MSDEWTKNQEKRFAADSVIEEALANPIQRERIDVAVKMIGGPGLKVLDVGCGDGAISELIHDNGNEVWGMDLFAVIATVPDKRKKWMQAVVGDASKKPWPVVPLTEVAPYRLKIEDENEFFDVVFAGEIIEHLLDIEPFLSEAHRVLKPDGRLVLTTPNAVRTLNRMAMLLGKVEPWHEWEHIPHHVRYFTPETLQAAVKKHDFMPLRMGYGRSQAEGSEEMGFDASWLEGLSPEERKVLMQIFQKQKNPVWRHSFIILESRKEVKSSGVG